MIRRAAAAALVAAAIFVSPQFASGQSDNSAVPVAASPAPAPAGPPVAPIKPVVENYYGKTVTDPYRWLEKTDDPAVMAWMRGQADYTKSVLASIPGRDQLLAKIEALDATGTSAGDVQIGGGRFFYLKEKPTFNNEKLFVRDTLHGPERILVDPEKLTKNGVHWSIDYYAASWDGKYVVYGVSPGGSEDDIMHVVDVASGKTLSDTIDRTRFGAPSWRLDNRSFYYNRLPKLAPGADPNSAEEMSRVYLHVLGSEPESDKLVFGYDVSPAVPVQAIDISAVQVVPASPYLFGVIEHGVLNELTLYAAPAPHGTVQPAAWRKIADVPDDVTAFDARGETVYLLSHRNAPRFKVLSTNLAHPDVAHAHVVVPPSKVVITALGVAKDGIYVQDLDGGISRLRRTGFDGGPATRIHLPYDGAIAAIVTEWNRDGLLFEETAWTHSALWYNYDIATGKAEDTGIKSLSPISFAGITSKEVQAPSYDGVLVPLSLIYKKGIALDGSHPTLLIGYGSYGITMSPYFSPTSLPWLSRGDVIAWAHVRGGGEYGEDWHHAGMKRTKPNTWRDMIACAQYLINKRFTSPKHLAIEGGSAGGITVGMSMTTRPDLFAAVIDQVGVSDPLRSELSPNGPPNIPEFGSFKTPDGFRDLYAMDAYQHVKDGVAYPAVLLTTGINDPRVSPWEPAKMTARLQAATSSGKPVLLRIDYDAGHGIGSTKLQRDKELADTDAFLLWQLGDPAFQPAKP